MNYLLLFGIGVVGWLIHALLKANTLKQKARIANVQFKFIEYFREDWISHCLAFLAIAAYLLVLAELLNGYALLNNYVRILTLTIGYMGADIISRFFSVINNKINKVIDVKTTESDSMHDTVDTPTPK